MKVEDLKIFFEKVVQCLNTLFFDFVEENYFVRYLFVMNMHIGSVSSVCLLFL